MTWNKFSLHAMGVPDRLTSDSSTWQNIFGFRSLWLWFGLFLSVSLTSLATLLLRRYRKTQTIDDTWLRVDPAIKSTQDSPFFAYLGHNVLTESRANDPTNTSTNAIDRIPEHYKLRSPPLTDINEDPLEYDLDDIFPISSSPRYRCYTYPDCDNKQIRLDRVEQMSDPDHDRQWQRRTMHVYAI